jgi:C1A family cysteine protease
MSYPESVDWRTKGAVTSVKSQGQCGASYAFSAMGALEGAQALANGNLKALSEQNIIDCSSKKNWNDKVVGATSYAL